MRRSSELRRADAICYNAAIEACSAAEEWTLVSELMRASLQLLGPKLKQSTGTAASWPRHATAAPPASGRRTASPSQLMITQCKQEVRWTASSISFSFVFCSAWSEMATPSC